MTMAEQSTDVEVVALTRNEAASFKKCETVIDHGLGTFVEVGKALATILQGRLYRETHTTFDDYCRARWSMTRGYAYRVMEAARTVDALPAEIVRPAVEAQARELLPLRAEPERMAAAWELAVEASSGRPTAQAVKEAVTRVRQAAEAPAPSAPAPAAPAVNEQGRARRLVLRAVETLYRDVITALTDAEATAALTTADCRRLQQAATEFAGWVQRVARS